MSQEMTPSEFKEALRGLDIWQAELARYLGVAQETVSRWANGHTPVPQYAVAYLEALQEQRRLRGVLEAIERDARTGITR